MEFRKFVLRTRRNDMFITGLGAIFFGLMIGGISYRMLRLTASTNVLSTIAIIIAVVGGAAVTTLLKDNTMFGWYAIGLVVGFLAYLAVGLTLYGKQELQFWQIPPAAATPIAPPGATPPDVEHGG
jgi:hypothetical protein